MQNESRNSNHNTPSNSLWLSSSNTPAVSKEDYATPLHADAGDPVNQQSDQSVDQLNNNNTIINNNNPLDVVFNPTSENNDNINPTPETPVGRTPHNSNDSITTSNGTSVTVENSGGPVDNNQQNVNSKLQPSTLDLTSCKSRKAYANRVHRESIIASP